MGALLDDKRTIVAISWPEEGGYFSPKQIGVDGVISIEVEPVDCCGGHMPWFAVHSKDGGFSRYNSAYVDGVKYAKTE
jgi:hypothetical protein